SVEDTNSAPAGGSVRGVINVPLGDKMAVRLGGFWDRLPGYIDDPIRKARNVNGTTYAGARLGVLFKPTDQLSIRLTAVTEDINNKGTNVQDVNRLTLATLYGDLTQSRTFSTVNKFEYKIYNATVDYDLGFANLVSASSFATLRQDELLDASGQLGALLTAVF